MGRGRGGVGLAGKHEGSEIVIVLPYGVVKVPADEEGRRLAEELRKLLRGGEPVSGA